MTFSTSQCCLSMSQLFCGRSMEKEHRCPERFWLLNADGGKGSSISSSMNAEFGSQIIFLKRYLSKQHTWALYRQVRNGHMSETGC